ncbi:hypothetical protein O4214_25115 [Rhodococcus erythropolis]|uniref:hypothetical protein n=1 Tax=Rhodococcus erythropolis TaxID=1833 RepID=UPI001E4CBE04|nr:MULTISPECIES: hypothetical protein [Rhodococcus erythropolis group]MCD2108146.1 hypothetical protein [Rhodococcus qingshengii]MCZ4527273.1 hypothetical protein [Rhodococcus erythropolis]
MIWMPCSKARRQALRHEVAATAATLREQLILVRTITESGESHGPRSDAARMRAKPTRDHFRYAAIRLPHIERQLACHWEHAAAMTFWYNSGDRGFAPEERRAGALLATLPYGLDTHAAQESIDAISNRAEAPLRHQATPHTTTTAVHGALAVVDQKGLRDRIADDHTRLKYQDVEVRDTATMLRAHHHYFPWIAHTLTYLSEPRSHAELEHIARQWRSERANYLDTAPPITIAAPQAIAGSSTPRHQRRGIREPSR